MLFELEKVKGKLKMKRVNKLIDCFAYFGSIRMLKTWELELSCFASYSLTKFQFQSFCLLKKEKKRKEE